MKQVLILLLIISVQFTQGLRISAGGSSLLHLQQTEGGSNDYGPSSPQRDLPSIKNFVNDAFGLQLGAEFQFKRSITDVAWAIGLDYERQINPFNQQVGSSGVNLIITSYIPKLTVRSYFNEISNISGSLGIPLRSYTLSAQGITVDNFFNPLTGIRAAFGLDFEKLSNSNFFINLSGSFEYGKTKTNPKFFEGLNEDIYDSALSFGIKIGMFFDNQNYEEEY